MPLGWGGILRLGAVQAALGAVVLLVTSTMNRVMVVELAFPAAVPGALVALHYALQVLRPRMGYGSDLGGRRTPWIIGGMGVLAAGGVLAALATAWMARLPAAGIALAVLAYTLVGVGVSTSGTSLLVLLAARVEPRRRAAAATIVWLMMLAGFAVTAAIVSKLLDPFSMARLIAVTAAASGTAFALTLLAIRHIEGPALLPMQPDGPAPVQPPFRQAIMQVWAEKRARRFALFVFISMFAYSAQELILEPFAGNVFAMSPGASARIAGWLHGGVFTGMLIVAICASLGRGWLASMRTWSVGGCMASAMASIGLIAAGVMGSGWPLQPNVFVLGVANGVFVIAAIGSMMGLASIGLPAREGVRMGLWGAAQAIAFGLGGLFGTLASDLARWLFGSPNTAYGAVFLGEAALFLFAAWQATQVFPSRSVRKPENPAIADGRPIISVGQG